jgi:putative transcriptional regulator
LKWLRIGKFRSMLGRYIDQYGLCQKELKKSGDSTVTIGRLCADNDHQPSMSTAKKVINFLKNSIKVSIIAAILICRGVIDE